MSTPGHMVKNTFSVPVHSGYMVKNGFPVPVHTRTYTKKRFFIIGPFWTNTGKRFLSTPSNGKNKKKPVLWKKNFLTATLYSFSASKRRKTN